MSEQGSLTGIKGIILDMDGVLWRGDQVIGDLPAIFAEMGRRGYRVIAATNNATRSIQQYLDRFKGFGVHLEPWQVINSPQAAAHYLRQLFPQGGPVFILGEEGLQQALKEAGFYHDEQHAMAVVVGIDWKLTYDKLARATLRIRSGLPFIGTNPDRTFPTPAGLVPGTGSILAALEAATEVKPHIVGKPAPAMYQVALDRLGTTPAETLVVGDRLETDIAGAQALGCRTALVLSGVTPEDRARTWQPAPDFIVADLTTLLQ